MQKRQHNTKSKRFHGTYKGLVGRYVKSSCGGGRPEADGGLEAVEAAGADGRRRVRPVEQVRRWRRRSRERVGRRQEALSDMNFYSITGEIQGR